MGGQKSLQRRLAAYDKYRKSFDYGTGTRVKARGGNLYGNGGFSIGNMNFTMDDLSKFGSDMTSILSNFGSQKTDPSLGKNINYSTPWGAAAGQAGSFTVDLLRAIDKLTDNPENKIYNPMYKTGLYADGGNLFATGGDVLGAISSVGKIASNAVGQAKLTTSYEDFEKALRNHDTNFQRSLAGVSDNDSLLMAYDNMAYVPGNITDRDFRDKSVMSDIADGFASSFEGFNAGSSFGPWGAAIGAIVGGVSSNVGSIIGRIKAHDAAEAGNKAVKKLNQGMSNRIGNLTDTVDSLNDRTREAAYMNLSAFGGDLSTHGLDFSNGLTFIDAGGSHEQNPLGGVPMGVDENGAPNLVEQNEVVWDDYVFSDRLVVPEEIQKKYKLKEGITFADAVKKLTEMSLERPNSPIDNDTNKAILNELRNVQEEVRSQMQAEAAQQYMQAAQDDQDLLSLALAENGMSPIQFPGMQEESASLMPPGFAMGGNLFEKGGPQKPKFAGISPFTTDDTLLASPPQQPESSFSSSSTPSSSRRPAGMSYGTWKQGDGVSNWNTFSRGSIEAYMQQQMAKYNTAKTPEEKKRIQEETMNTINLIQTGYQLSFDRQAGKARVSDDPIVRRHQENWNTKVNGNAGFTKIAEAQNLPAGHKSGDDAQHNWTDGLWGPQTSIRHAGSSQMSDDDMKTLVEGFNSMGLTYSPTLSYGKNGDKLYTLQIAEPVQTNTGTKSTPPADGAGVIVHDGNLLADFPGEGEGDGGLSFPDTGQTGGGQPTGMSNGMINSLRMAPIYGSGMAALNGLLNDPEYDNADAILGYARKMGTPITIPVRTIGDYRARRPFDERYLVNMALRNRTAAMRSGINTAGGNRALQLGYASALAHQGQNELAEIMRQAYLANRADDAQVAEFNRGTNQFNATSINNRNQTQAQLNSQREAQALSGISTGYQLRQRIKDAWDQATAQNLSNLFNSLGSLGKEKGQNQMIQSMAENGYFPYGYGQNGQGYDLSFLSQLLDNMGSSGGSATASVGACGGKLKKKRRF